MLFDYNTEDDIENPSTDLYSRMIVIDRGLMKKDGVKYKQYHEIMQIQRDIIKNTNKQVERKEELKPERFKGDIQIDTFDNIDTYRDDDSL